MLSPANYINLKIASSKLTGNADSPIQVAIADDHKLFIKGIAGLFSDIPILELCASFFDGQQLLDWYNGQNADIILMDLHMPKLNGIEASKELLSRFPLVKIMVLSVDNTPAAIQRMKDMGVYAYLVKDAEPDYLIDTIISVHNGEKVFSPTASNDKSIKIKELTTREMQILKLLMEGKNTKQMAHVLCLSARTVKRHRENILHAVGAINTAQLVAIMNERGL